MEVGTELDQDSEEESVRNFITDVIYLNHTGTVLASPPITLGNDVEFEGRIYNRL